MFALVGRFLNGVRNFFAASWAYLKSSNATFSSLGDDLVTSAQNDLMNLKGKLDELWTIRDEDKATMALYLSALLGKFGFTFIIIGVSFISSLIKLTGGSLCLVLAGRFFTLLSKVFNIFSEIFSYTLTFIRDGLKTFLTKTIELANKFLRKLAEYASRFVEASLNLLRAIGSYLRPIGKILLDFLSAAFKNLVSLAKWIGNRLLNFWQSTLDFVAAFCRAIRSLVVNFLPNLKNAVIYSLHGITHLAVSMLKAVTIFAKGIVLSVAALFIETGLAQSLSGVAKTAFILEESLASGVGALMDGIYASGKLFFKAVQSIFGYADPATDISTGLLSGIGNEVNSELDGEDYSRNARASVRHVNECVASAGNYLLNSYQSQQEPRYYSANETNTHVPRQRRSFDRI